MKEKEPFRIENRLVWTPAQLATFLLNRGFEYAFYSDTSKIRRKFQLKISEKKIKKLITHPDYYKAIDEIFIEHAKKDDTIERKFWALCERYYEQNMKSDAVSKHAVEFFGILSGKYNPKPDTQTNINIITQEQKKLFKEIGKAAIKNRWLRLGEIDNEDN